MIWTRAQVFVCFVKLILIMGDKEELEEKIKLKGMRSMDICSWWNTKHYSWPCSSAWTDLEGRWPTASSATGGPRSKTVPPAITSGTRPQPDYVESGWFWNEYVMTAIRVYEWSGAILNGARRGFFKGQSVVVFTRSKSTPLPSRVQFMPTTCNITAYLDRIHMLIFS